MRQRADGSGTAEQRREQMLRAALEVIAERGYPETRIADVAERAGTSPALVIYYFKTKNQLLTEAMRFSEDRWYETGTSWIAAIDTAAGRLEELVAMSCLPEADADLRTSWLLWLDLWAQAGRHPEVGGVRQKFDERWRETISSLVVAWNPWAANSRSASAWRVRRVRSFLRSRSEVGGWWGRRDVSMVVTLC